MKVGDIVYMIAERPVAEWGYCPEDGGFISPYYPVRGVVVRDNGSDYTVFVNNHTYHNLYPENLFVSEADRDRYLDEISVVADRIYNDAVSEAYNKIDQRFRVAGKLPMRPIRRGY